LSKYNRAFPLESMHNMETGISQLDYFAAQALTTFDVSKVRGLDGGVPDEIATLWAKSAFKIAEAMIKESERRHT